MTLDHNALAMLQCGAMVDSVNSTQIDPASLLREVGRLHVRAQRETTSCCSGRTAAQCHVLGELARSGPLPLTELARRVGADKGWTSRAVDALARDGLVSRSASELDGRVVRVGLTPRGRQRWRAIDDVLRRQALAVLSKLPRAEVDAVSRALVLLRDALAAHIGGARGEWAHCRNVNGVITSRQIHNGSRAGRPDRSER